jgi:alpha-amylase
MIHPMRDLLLLSCLVLACAPSATRCVRDESCPPALPTCQVAPGASDGVCVAATGAGGGAASGGGAANGGGAASDLDAGPDGLLRLGVGSVFPPGTALRDRYSGATAAVDDAGTVAVRPDDAGVVLLEREGAAAPAFRWADATVYFVLTDRFRNGDPENDHAYGRQSDGAQEIGTWHGGDFAGLTQQLDYLAALGVGAIWLSPPVEQVHGWVGGGKGDFKYYGYHGYWALDFTRLDKNLGTEAELRALVDGAHQRGLRVLFDVVLNHPGYATGDDLVAYVPEVFKDGTGDAFKAFVPAAGQTYFEWNNLVDYSSVNWSKWWTPAWIRAGLGITGQFTKPGTDDLTSSLAFLPDFKTEATGNADAPPFWARKSDTLMTLTPNATVRAHLVAWHADWVRRFGIDGFRCDTAKNVEFASWRALKDAATAALAEWKAANPTKKLDDAPFWMTGEAYGHGVGKDGYYALGGFDSLLNFDFQPKVRDLLTDSPSLAEGAVALEKLYALNAGLIGGDSTFGVLNYLSSHDTRLFIGEVGNSPVKMRQALTALMLAPGNAQLFYGDESGRALGPAGMDPVQATRSDMNWTSTDAATLAHVQRLGAFRKAHPALATGAHAQLPSPPGTYAFSRTQGTQDAVVVVLLPPN